MTEMIADGKGTGFLAGVTSENRVKVGAVTVTKEHHSNFTYQDAYNVLFNVTPTGAGDYFLYVKNTSAKKIICEGFSIQCSTNEIIQIVLDFDGTPVNGTDVVPANLTSGSGNKAVGIFQTGNDITGLNGGTIVSRYSIEGSNNSNFRNFDADIMIPQNQTLAMCAINGGIVCNGFLMMWHDHGGI